MKRLIIIIIIIIIPVVIIYIIIFGRDHTVQMQNKEDVSAKTLL